MEQDAEAVIVALKQRFHVATDQGLAEVLKVGRSTVASWRSRGQVPKRYSRFVDVEEFDLFGLGIGHWTSDERATAVLALMRMHQGYLGEIDSYPEFLRRGGMVFTNFTMCLEKAYLDLQRTMDEQGVDDPWQCLNLIVFEECFQPVTEGNDASETDN